MTAAFESVNQGFLFLRGGVVFNANGNAKVITCHCACTEGLRLNGFPLIVVAIAAGYQQHCSQHAHADQIFLRKQNNAPFLLSGGATVLSAAPSFTFLLTLAIQDEAVRLL